MTENQISVLRSALADLIGAQQAHEQNDTHAHDWRAHQLSIDELSMLLEILE